MASDTHVTGVERTFPVSEIIVSKTDLKGRITYANEVFLQIAGYSEAELLGQPHNIIRHPEMPRSIFKMLWDTIAMGKEIFAYVINRSKNGDHYWVYAHVSPSFDATGNLVGYHSNRRVPDRSVLDSQIIPLYQDLLKEEASHANRKEGMLSAVKLVQTILGQKGLAYDEFIARLAQAS